MTDKQFENAIIIINETRLEQLNQRFNTKAQAKFYIEKKGSNFSDYEDEYTVFKRTVETVSRQVGNQLKYKILQRKYISNFIFTEKDIAIVIGQDGLVANVAKYVNGIPILAINPDVNRYDGVLLPFNVSNFENGLEKILQKSYKVKQVTMAEALMNDGQRLLAFNDFFIGPSSHISARYKIYFNGKSENQSSSGIIISTGAGSTGWLSSVFNMANGIQSSFQSSTGKVQIKLDWEDKKLVFVVREPFLSKYSQINITGGFVTDENKLRIESLMPESGLIFSDGLESDFMKFTSGSIVDIGIAEQKAMIVQNN